MPPSPSEKPPPEACQPLRLGTERPATTDPGSPTRVIPTSDTPAVRGQTNSPPPPRFPRGYLLDTGCSAAAPQPRSPHPSTTRGSSDRYDGTGAICDGIITVVGDDKDVAPHVGTGTKVVDALGRRVIPGLDDSHLHVIRAGLNYVLELRWDGARSLRQGLAMLSEQAARTPKGQWVRVMGGAGRPSSSPSAGCRPSPN